MPFSGNGTLGSVGVGESAGSVRSSVSGKAATVEEVDENGEDGDSARAQYDRALLKVVQRSHEEASFDGPAGYDSDASDTGSRSGSERSMEERMEKRAAEYAGLAELGNRLARVSAMQLANVLRKARFPTNSPRRGGEVRQLMFGLEGTEAVDDLEVANGLYDRILQGRVMTQVVARTGLGKSTRLPGMLASKCGARVLLLQPTIVLAAASADRLRGVSKVRTRWLRSREESVTTMTYADFCGHFQTSGGAKILEQFDVVLMDEAHTPEAEVVAAKMIFATKAGADGPSLIVLSATVDGQDSQAINNSAPTKILRGTLMNALKSGALTAGSRALDRTMLVFPTDEEAAEAADLIGEEGHVAYTLDSASRTNDYWAVMKQLKQPSVNKRYVVITNEFGTGTNLPVAQVYMSGVRVVHEINEENRVTTKRIGLTHSERKQQAARVNRGLAVGSGSYVFDECEASDDVLVLPSERVKLYLLLRAAGIKPLKQFLPSSTLFKFGVTPEVASNVLSINLPPELAIRFFNADGCVSPNFARALQPFSHVQHYFITSSLEGPLRHDEWIVEKVGGYYDAEMAEHASVKVPFHVEDENLRARLHAIAASAQGRINLLEYVPRLSDGETSEEEVMHEPVQRRGRKPRLVVDAERALPPPPKALPWSYDAREEEQLSFRPRPQAITGSSYSDAVIRSLRDTETVLTFPTCQVTSAVDDNNVERVEVRSPVLESSPVEVKTPRGSVVVSLRKTVWDKLLEPECLSAADVVSLVKGIKHNVKGFAGSDAFSNWNNIWLGILYSFQSRDNLRELQHRGLMHSAASLMFELYNRYENGVQGVTTSSYAKAKFWSRIVGGRTVEEQLKRDREKGKVEIIQSQEFFMRVYVIRDNFGVVLREFGDIGWFAPEVNTHLQRVLPIMGASSRGTDDAVLRVARGQSGATIRQMGAMMGVGSSGSLARSYMGRRK